MNSKERREQLKNELLAMLTKFVIAGTILTPSTKHANGRLYQISKQREIEIIFSNKSFCIDYQNLNFWDIDGDNHDTFISAIYGIQNNNCVVLSTKEDKEIWRKINRMLSINKLELLISEIGIDLV
jgi:hypothetical protein